MSDTNPDPPSRDRVERADSVLVRETLTGDSYAFDELVERYQGKIYNLALGVTGTSQDAKDATQNAFLKAYENLARFDPSHKFFSWIYRIGVNESLNIVNRRRRVVALEAETAAPTAGPERQAAARETGRAIREALEELVPDLRITIVLRHFHGLTYGEMSEVIGIPAARVKSRLFTARFKLRRRLAEKGLGPGSHRKS